MSIPARPYTWPHDGQFSKHNTALVIIDMQSDFCSPGGYLSHQGQDPALLRAPIPNIAALLQEFRSQEFPIFHTREGHRSDLSDLSPRELFRSRNNPTGMGIGDMGPMGRLLVRGEAGHDIIPEVYPTPGESIVDKPGKSAFAHTDFELLLKGRNIRNLVICGVTTDVCVNSTVREASDKGYECLVVANACAATSPFLHEAAIEMVVTEGGIFGAVIDDAAILLDSIRQ